MLGNFNLPFLGGSDEQEDNVLDESGDLCSLSPLQRFYAFAACLAVAVACMFLSLLVFYRPIKFAVLFSLANIMAVGSTAFLIGPMQQFRMMFDPIRVYAAVIYIGSVVLTLVCALCIHNKILTLVAILVEICALIWYSLSYIPFARRMASQLIISCCDTEI